MNRANEDKAANKGLYSTILKPGSTIRLLSSSNLQVEHRQQNKRSFFTTTSSSAQDQWPLMDSARRASASSLWCFLHFMLPSHLTLGALGLIGGMRPSSMATFWRLRR